MKRAFRRTHPWLQELTEGDLTPDRPARFMHTDHRIDGVDVRVVELTGNAGDVVLMHSWLLHSFAPNCGSGPRFMRVRNLYQKDVH